MSNPAKFDEHTTDLMASGEILQFIKKLEMEHFNLAQLLHPFYDALQNANGRGEGEWRNMIPAIREQVLILTSQLDRHLEAEEKVLLPAMALYCKAEHTFPSVRFSTLLMEQHFHSARAYFQLFIDQSGEPKERLSEVKRMTAYLREGLIALAEYLKVERRFVLNQAEQMVKDM